MFPYKLIRLSQLNRLKIRIETGVHTVQLLNFTEHMYSMVSTRHDMSFILHAYKLLSACKVDDVKPIVQCSRVYVLDVCTIVCRHMCSCQEHIHAYTHTHTKFALYAFWHACKDSDINSINIFIY